MRKLVPALMGLMLLCAFALAACGESSVAASPTDTPAPALSTATTAPAPTATSGVASAGVIGMGVTTFSHASTTIKVGQSVTFMDPADTGGVHNIVTGSAGKFAAQAGAPSAFATASGVNFAPGDSQTFIFTTAGTYTFTCTIHPSMRATVTVKP